MILKCKMCGGDLPLIDGQSTLECEYCGTRQTIPSADSEKKLTLFNRANRLRMGAEFDKAMGVYESIVTEYPQEAEAYWGLCLCAYGIEYVDDPRTGEKIPTCHRTRPESILDSANFQMACEYADAVAKQLYRSEAESIDALQRDILTIVAKESPYDVFICYKETGEDGERTQDSVLAQEIYDALTSRGLKVFFARITLEDKLGKEYEPYIYAALHSAKVMLAIGTSYEHFDAVWVKNEWSRFLDMAKEDKGKVLIPCYRDLDAYDLPKAMRGLQAQDMGKLGFLQDIVRGVEKLLGKTAASAQRAAAPVQATAGSTGVSVQSLMRRAQLFLEDGEWNSASEYLDKVLDIDPEYAPAYIGKLLVSFEMSREEEISAYEEPEKIETDADWGKAMRFATPEQRAVYERYLDEAKRAEKLRKEEEVFEKAQKVLNKAKNADDCEEAERIFATIPDYPGAKEAAAACRQKAEEFREATYQKLLSELEQTTTAERYKRIGQAFSDLGDYRDSAVRAENCFTKAKEIEEAQQAAEQRLKEEGERKRKETERRLAQKKARQKRRNALVCIAVLLIAAAGYLYLCVIEPSMRYSEAEKLLEEEKYDEAVVAFQNAGRYSDAELRVNEVIYLEAEKLLKEGKTEEAIYTFLSLGAYRDAQERAIELLNSGRIAAGWSHTVGLQSDRSVVAVGSNDRGQCEVSDWEDIVSVVAGSYHTVGLKSDGSVVAVGDNEYGQCDVSDWKDIVSVAAGGSHTVGLKSDGSVVAVGANKYGQCDVSAWKNIVSIVAQNVQTIGLKTDGSVVAIGSNSEERCSVSGWRNIESITTGMWHTVGVKSDGSVVAVGNNDDGQCEVSAWKNIVSVAAGQYHTVGLQADGSVVAVGKNDRGQCKVSDWRSIVSISAGIWHTVGLKADGSVVAVGNNNDGQCNVEEWNLF